MNTAVTYVVRRKSPRFTDPGTPEGKVAVRPKRVRTVLKPSPSAGVFADGGHVPAPLAHTPLFAVLHPFHHPTPRRSSCVLFCASVVCFCGFELCVSTDMALAVTGRNACICTIRLVIVSSVNNLVLVVGH